MMTPVRPNRGHNLLEAIVATGIFILVAVALSGVWVMYGSALAKSGEQLAANHLARSLTEGLVSNGYDWLTANPTGPAPPGDACLMERSIRGRDSSVSYRLAYRVDFNTAGAVNTFLPAETARLTVTVEWQSDKGSNKDGSAYNNSLTYSTYVYRRALDG